MAGVTILVLFALLAFSVGWFRHGGAVLNSLWWSRPELRLTLSLIVAIVCAAALCSFYVVASFWARSLRKNGFLREENPWLFWKLKGNRAAQVETATQTFNTRRITLTFFCLLWGGIGAGAALFVLVPVGLWLLGGLPQVRTGWNSVSGPGGTNLWTVLLTLLWGVAASAPLVWFTWFRIVKGWLHLTDEEIAALIGGGR